MKSYFFRPVSYLFGIGIVTIVSSTLASAETPNTHALLENLTSEAGSLPTVEPAVGHELQGDSPTEEWENTVGQLSGGSDPSPTPSLRGERLFSSPLLGREGSWGVKFSELAHSILDSTAVPPSSWTDELATPEDGIRETYQADSQILELKGMGEEEQNLADGADNAIAATQPLPGTVETSAAYLTAPLKTPVLSPISADEADTLLAQTDLDLGRVMRQVPNYIGVGGNLGLSSDNDQTALGGGGFVVISKIDLTETLSLRPSVIFGSDAVFLIPLTYDFTLPRVDPFEPIRFAPFLGGGVAFSTNDNNNIGFLLTGGVDIPLSPTFVANASLNVGFIEDTTDFGLILGVGYTFPNLFRR